MVQFFQRWVAFVDEQRRDRKIFGDVHDRVASLWVRWIELDLIRPEREQLKQALIGATLDKQVDVWRWLGNDPTFGGRWLPWVQMQFARSGDFPAMTSWETLRPFQSPPGGNFKSTGVYAVVVPHEADHEAPPASPGVVFMIAVIAVPSSQGPRESPYIRPLGFVADQRALDEAAGLARRWFGWAGGAILIEYALRANLFVVAVPQIAKMVMAGIAIRRTLARCQFYVLADMPGLHLEGESLGLPVFAAILRSVFRLAGPSDLWEKLLPRLAESGFSGRIDNGSLLPVTAHSQKISALKEKGIKDIFISQPASPGDYPYRSQSGVHLVRSRYGFMRRLMSPRKTWVAVNVVFLYLCIRLPVAINDYLRPIPIIQSLLGDDTPQDFKSVLISGNPLRVRSNGVVSLRIEAGSSAGETELIVRSGRLDTEGRRSAVLKYTSYDLRPASELLLTLKKGAATFVYSGVDSAGHDPKERPSEDILEVGLRCRGALIAWYPLHVSISRSRQQE